MTPMPVTFLDRINRWPQPVQLRVQALRLLFHEVARQADVGPLDEALKWGQLAWRPQAPRTGSTVRLNWSETAPGRLMVYVDCKTDLAAQMQTRFPDLPGNDGRRMMQFDLDHLDPDALWQLAYLTFTYHRTKRRAAH